MLKVVLLQVGAASLGVVLCAALWGQAGALSALLGGLVYIIPSAWFAWRLSIGSRQHAVASTSLFFIGEAVKILLAIGILVAVRLLFPGAHWGALVVGLIITLQANFLAFLVKP